MPSYRQRRFIILLVVLVFGIAVYSLWSSARGVIPALAPPPLDIATQISIQKSYDGPLQFPPEFKMTIFAKDLGAPRDLESDSEGNILVSIPSEGRVVVMSDKDHDGQADKIVTLLSGLRHPHGLAILERSETQVLFVAEEHELTVYDYDTLNLSVNNKLVIAALPTGGRHITRSLAFLREAAPYQLLVSIGSSCDVCLEKDARQGSVMILTEGESGLRPYASGLRNAVFMARNPKMSQVWATEMGRDFLGDDLPPDEINVLEQEKDYGWPFCYGQNMRDTTFEPRRKIVCAEPRTSSSSIDLPAHSAPLGLAFTPLDSDWSAEYQNNLFVAYHGSWNRSVPTGYKIVRFILESTGSYGQSRDFVTGWLEGGRALGRPVDVHFGRDSALYVSDDKAGVIYRLKP